MNIANLEAGLNYSFADIHLLLRALTHRSHSHPHNERLEFLGDSILNCVIAFELYALFNHINEGDLSRLRANLVRQETLCELAQELSLGDYLRLGEGEMRSGGARRPSILADALEAVFGAIFLDRGFESVRAVIRNLYQSFLTKLDPALPIKDAKSLLQEHLQGRKIPLPQYNIIATHGEAHQQQFEVECLIPQLGIRELGSGTSRRGAEQEAAQRAYQQVMGVKSEG